MTNIECAARLIAEVDGDGKLGPIELAQALAAEGCLMPDLPGPFTAETITGMEWEWAVQIESPRGGRILTGAAWHHSREVAEEELRSLLVIPPGWNCRLVRRPVGPVEVIED